MIEKRYYTASTLRSAVAVYEREYGMSSDEFFKAHTTDAETLNGIPGFQRSLWAGLLQELCQFDGRDMTSTFVADHGHSFRLAV